MINFRARIVVRTNALADGWGGLWLRHRASKDSEVVSLVGHLRREWVDPQAVVKIVVR